MKRVVMGAAVTAALLLAGTAQAALQDRDLDGDGQTDAFYDTDLDITWLRDANVNGSMNWDTAVAWVGTFSFGGVNDWRLPASDACIFSFNCTGSEMGHLWYTELGNVAGGPLTNAGDFQNLQSFVYWSGTPSSRPLNSILFRTDDGWQAYDRQGLELYAMAVRDGDVPALPERGTCALMLAGLAGLTLRRRAAAAR
jgi:hypothetical protein